jgi:hypothetical protein
MGLLCSFMLPSQSLSFMLPPKQPPMPAVPSHVVTCHNFTFARYVLSMITYIRVLFVNGSVVSFCVATASLSLSYRYYSLKGLLCSFVLPSHSLSYSLNTF